MKEALRATATYLSWFLMAYVAPDMGMIQVVVDGEVINVHSAILTLTSPVFKEMLSNGMKETTEKKIYLPGKCKDEFKVFMSFLHPGTTRTARITNKNVDFLLEWFDEYGIATLKDECENFLLRTQVNVDRLLQSRRFKLNKQYKRCLNDIARDFEDHELDRVIKTDPDILLDLLPIMKDAKKELQIEISDKLEAFVSRLEAVPAKLFEAMPCLEAPCGSSSKRQRIDEYVRDQATQLLANAMSEPFD